MADRREESASESSSTSDDSSSEGFESPSQSSESEDSEESNESSTRSRPSTSKPQNVSKRPASKSTSKGAAKKKREAAKESNLSEDQMEELSSWIFSTERSAEVEANIRSRLLESLRVKTVSERQRFANHLLCETQKHNFQLLLVGFCRKFSTLASECFALPDKANRKAAFSVAWMKLLSNFQPGKAIQQRSIIERFLVGQQFDAEVVHAVVSVVHEMVYHIIHAQIQSKKSATTSEARTSKLNPETDDTLYRYCGAALHRMIKLRKETLKQKKGRAKLSSQRQPIMELELALLEELTMKDKSSVPQSLKNLDEGNLVFPRTELLPFLKQVDNNVREFTCDSNLSKYPTIFIDMCQTSVLNNEGLEVDFRLLVAAIASTKGATDSAVVSGLFKALVSKFANTRINEFMNAKIERDLKSAGKVVDADEMLRPKLKSYSVSAKRK
ncbi:hypothetical protein OS493_007265 [Desmophyllum pertusum]|uniref:Uncharacterized protein n=1 Tax=Desmophyllum pertusum TaxID=174260 RepID=A0A9W9Z2Z7_9CNID|nr:hypothetical protein OS493_007265 [Desmophyllum pertusum]